MMATSLELDILVISFPSFPAFITRLLPLGVRSIGSGLPSHNVTVLTISC
jgi:hypothetical protein